MSDPVEERAQAEKTSTDAAESSLRAEEQTQIRQMSGLKMTIRLSGKHETAKRKWMTQCTDEQMSPFLKKSKKSRHSFGQDSEPVLVGVKDKVSVDASDCEHSDSNVNTVKLTLFGSKRQGKGSPAFTINTGNIPSNNLFKKNGGEVLCQLQRGAEGN
ncbi:hypothetical protein F2P81_007271 [Scophthalmus maximus]|uniref:Uncharacterized protein n=1 Tax=Scophthalmus maximus TaxID=52904 RepID=A0A6A4T5W8_SCOMX|nr:hypothetical protein F2P81_007271 [Scophthalmus maximus]